MCSCAAAMALVTCASQLVLVLPLSFVVSSSSITMICSGNSGYVVVFVVSILSHWTRMTALGGCADGCRCTSVTHWVVKWAALGNSTRHNCDTTDDLPLEVSPNTQMTGRGGSVMLRLRLLVNVVVACAVVDCADVGAKSRGQSACSRSNTLLLLLLFCTKEVALGDDKKVSFFASFRLVAVDGNGCT